LSQKIGSVIKRKSVLIGIAAFVIVSILGAVIYSVMLLQDNVSNESINNIVTIIYAIGSVISGIVSGAINKCKGIQIGALNGIIQILLILLLSIILREKTPIFTTENLIRFITILLSSAIGGIIGVNFKRKF